LGRQSAITAPRSRATTAALDSEPKLIAEIKTIEAGWKTPGRLRRSLSTVAHGTGLSVSLSMGKALWWKYG
jgi:hypothetical protein